jgi:hypothetical protein
MDILFSRFAVAADSSQQASLSATISGASSMHKMNKLAAEVQELVCAVVDGQATDSQLSRMEELLRDDPQARQIYLDCMQMHADLSALLGDKPAAPLPVASLPPMIAGTPISGGC